MSSRTATLNIATPEGVTFSLPLAGPVVRGLAYFIDFAAISAVWNVVALAITPVFMLLQDIGVGFGIVLQFAFVEGARMLMEIIWRGQTVGKKVLGLRVVDEQGLKLRISQVVIRNLLRFVDMLPALYAVGGVVSLFSPRAQRLGDLAAGTVVVRSIKSHPPDVASVLSGKYNSFRAYPHLEARLRQKVTPEEAQLALQTLVRREELESAARLQIYEQLATHLREKVAFPDDAVFGLTDEQYIRNVVDTVFRGRK